MNIEQMVWKDASGWKPFGAAPASAPLTSGFLLVFGSAAIMEDGRALRELRERYPSLSILGCSTAGEIIGTMVNDDTVVATAVHFDHVTTRCAHVRLGDPVNSFQAGEELARLLAADDLVHLFTLSDGLAVNGSDLVRGLSARLPAGVAVTGGLAGDGTRFRKTIVACGDEIGSGVVAAIGFYGKRLKVGFASLGGWDPFGPERLITRSQGNVLYELDGRSALDLYKEYLGDHAAGLPATGLLFPLTLRLPESEQPVVRTILAVSEGEKSMTFAGDMPQGVYARLMRANIDRLIDGATLAAKTSFEAMGSRAPELAILISCVGRKLVLKQRVEEEVEGVRDVLGDAVALTGFYSYGEISPFKPGVRSELHNQTMTITTLSEV
ncbi:MAG: FIST N-terminal domain-containing protein [bacterium]